MNISFNQQGNTLTITPPQSLTAELQKEFRHVYDNEKITEYIIDLRHTTFADSSGLGLLMLLYGTTKAKNPKLSIINAALNLKEILQIGGLSGFYDIK